MSKQKAIIVSGYFNPIHKGHLEYFNNAKAMADKLFVIVNNDHQRELKGRKEFQDENERVFIVENLRLVDKCFLSIDKDRTVIFGHTPTAGLPGHSSLFWGKVWLFTWQSFVVVAGILIMWGWLASISRGQIPFLW